MEVVKYLVEAGADMDKARTGDGSTPLCIAAECSHSEMVRCSMMILRVSFLILLFNHFVA